MTDPFEVRMRFSHQLQHLNASVTSVQKAAQYAIRYKDLGEDLHSCIVEQLEKTTMNTRANIMYFIEHFLEVASKERNDPYVRMMQRDIIRVVDAVCPEDGSGAANVKVVRRVLGGLRTKQILLEQTVVEIEELLKERDTSSQDLGMSSPANGDAKEARDPANATASAAAAEGSSSSRPPPQLQRNGSTTSSVRPDKRQIEQRIEEDRERHKRLRESMWVTPAGGEEAEMWKMWEDTSDFGEDDHILAQEEYDEWSRSREAAKCPHLQEQSTDRGAGGGRERERERDRDQDKGRGRDEDRDRDRGRDRERTRNGDDAANGTVSH